MSAGKNTAFASSAILLICMLLVAISHAGLPTDKNAAEAQQTGGESTMREQAHSSIGKRFPEVTGTSLAKTPESIPDSARGKITLVAVAFLRESQAQLDSWLGPFTERFGNREGFTFYEVPMLSTGYRLMRPLIDGGMRAGIPDAKHKHVVTMYGNVKKYVEELSMDTRLGYAFLLDREGIIRWQGQGFATPETLQELFDTAEKLL